MTEQEENMKHKRILYVTVGTLQKKVKNLTLTVREFNKRIVLF
jgi:hypothetical protein